MKSLKLLLNFKYLTCCFVLLISLSTSAFSQQASQRSVTRHGNWASHCTVNAPVSCYIIHNVTLGGNPKPVLTMAMGRPVNGSADVTSLILTLPLGVRLPEGFSLEVGSSIRRSYPFERCIVSGCQAEISVDPQLLQEFKSQNEGRVVFFDAVKKPIAVPFSLKGFTNAFSRVTNP
ncbi:invasion associated locus B family protein [Kiloniella antarctica]|uniref:Invasion associated locus B family protein n=1 Tax=Kiloniella antarctica TaxID=1550907 RepID=A0ABW5BQV6_9PROT